MKTLVSVCAGLVLVTAAFVGCGGGSQEPAESPEVPPPAEPGEGSIAPQGPDEGTEGDAGAGEHTMPDGSTMPGTEHPEGSDHSGHH